VLSCLTVNAQAPGPGPRRAGGFNGGGGYSVLCKDGKAYALDYKGSRGSRDSAVAPVLEAASSLNEVSELLLKTLDAKLYEASVDFRDFLKFNLSFETTSKILPNFVKARRVWIDGSAPLGLNGDHQTLRDPAECKDEQGRLNLQQLVVRREEKNANPRVVTFDRYLPAIQELEKNHGLQASFAYVHEWLRDYTDDPIMIMRLNAFLHSKKFFEMPKEDVPAYLAAMGFKFPDIGTSTVSALRDLKPNQKMSVQWNGNWISNTLLDPTQKLVIVVQVCADPGDYTQYRACTLVFKSPEFAPNPQQSLQDKIWGSSYKAYPMQGTKIPYDNLTLIKGEQILDIVNAWREQGIWKDEYGVTFLFQLIEVSPKTAEPTSLEARSLGVERARTSRALSLLSQGKAWKTGGGSVRIFDWGPGYEAEYKDRFTSDVYLSSAACQQFPSCARAQDTDLALEVAVDPVGDLYLGPRHTK